LFLCPFRSGLLFLLINFKIPTKLPARKNPQFNCNLKTQLCYATWRLSLYCFTLVFFAVMYFLRFQTQPNYKHTSKHHNLIYFTKTDMAYALRFPSVRFCSTPFFHSLATPFSSMFSRSSFSSSSFLFSFSSYPTI